MQAWATALLGEPAQVEVTECEPEKLLAWEASVEAEVTSIEAALSEKGWGTNVELSADGYSDSARLERWLDWLLDELAEPERRPFQGMV